MVDMTDEARGRIRWLLAGVLVVVTGLVFCGVTWTGFIEVDDPSYVLFNTRVRTGITPENASWAWSSTDQGGFWLPLTWMSLQIDSSISRSLGMDPAVPKTLSNGLKVFPDAAVFKLHNLGLHLVGTVFLFLALERATKRRWESFAAALLWAIHPLRVESVAWVTERKDVLAGAFGFAAIYGYIAWAERGRWWRYGITAILLVLSMMAKAMFVVFPVLAIVLDWWPLRRGEGTGFRWLLRAMAEKWLFWALAIASGVMTIITQQKVGALASGEWGLFERIEHASVAYVMELIRQVRVWDLTVFYTFPPVERYPLWETGLCLTMLLAITATCVAVRRSQPWMLTGWLWYLAGFFPTSGIMQVGNQAYADRFSYLPAVGLMVMLAYSFSWGWRPAARRSAAGIAAVLAIYWSGFTVRQISYWQDSITLLQRTVDLTDNHYQMDAALAMAYLRAGHPDLAIEHYTQSAEGIRAILNIYPNRGSLLEKLGEVDKSRGYILLLRRDPAALPVLGEAAGCLPNDAQAHFLYGCVLDATNQLEQAMAEYRRALELDPKHPQAEKNLMRLEQERMGRGTSQPQ